MKGLKLGLMVLMATMLAVGLGGMAYAFHSGGVAECEGCHSMHNSFEGEPNVTGRSFAQGTGPYLLKANDQSGACLNCHNAADTAPSGYHVSTNGVVAYDTSSPVEMTPGGDFAWLKKTMSYQQVRGTSSSTITVEGARHGHNVYAGDFGYVGDPTFSVAPGGSYPAGAPFGCQSCHDPHGRYRRLADGSVATTGLPIFNSGSYNNSKDPVAGVAAVGVYRILGGAGYQPKSLGGSYAFTANPPTAVVASTYNRSEATAQTGIAYGADMSEWCANCHTGMLQASYTSGMAGLRHPSGNGAKLTAEIANNYNAYVSSGIMTNTTAAAAFSTLAPFEEGQRDYSQLKAHAVTSSTYSNQNMVSASTNAQVACTSCHRSHASAFESMLRWNYAGGEFMTAADSANNAIYDSVNGRGTGYSQTQQQNAYYGRQATVFGPNARVYCNKCHAKD